MWTGQGKLQFMVDSLEAEGAGLWQKAFDTLKAQGVGLLTSYGDKWLGDKSFAPVFEELNRRGAILYSHPTDATCCHNLIPGINPGTIEWNTDTSRAIFSVINDGTPALSLSVLNADFDVAAALLDAMQGKAAGKTRGVTLAVALFVLGLTVGGAWSGLWSWVVVAVEVPSVVSGSLLAVAPPSATALRRVGWTIVVVATITAALVAILMLGLVVAYALGLSHSLEQTVGWNAPAWALVATAGI